MSIVDNATSTLRAQGKDEKWLQEWIKEKPSRLGLGNVRIDHVELRQYGRRGGRLDILAYSPALDTYYEIELMLGECDADHGFRTLDYWARERLRHPNSRHVAVLVAEDLSGRYRTVIDTLPEFLPFIGIELQTLVMHGDAGVATIVPTVVAQPDDLLVKPPDEPVSSPDSASPRDEEWWEGNTTETYMAGVRELAALCNERIGESRVDYSAVSYISLKKGRRCWLPMWPRKEGMYVHIPGGPDGSVDEPSSFFHSVQEKLAPLGIEPSWTWKYNMGANPVGFVLQRDQVSHTVVLEVLRQAYELA